MSEWTKEVVSTERVPASILRARVSTFYKDGDEEIWVAVLVTPVGGLPTVFEHTATELGMSPEQAATLAGANAAALAATLLLEGYTPPH